MPTLEEIAEDNSLLERARKAIEDELIWHRNSHVSLIRNNGLVVKQMDGTPSHLIRMGAEEAVSIGLKAIIRELAERGQLEGYPIRIRGAKAAQPAIKISNHVID